MPTDMEIMLGFESLGDNCEFGFAQRAYGAEPALSLFRWASTEFVAALRILRDRFAGLAPENLSVRPIGDEWGLDNSAYGLFWHTFATVGAVDEQRILARERRRISSCVEATLHHLTAADRVFVVKRNHELPRGAVDDMVDALRSYGPNQLLWVCSDPDRAGIVERLGPGLLRGFIPAFADTDKVTVGTNAAAWLNVCRTAHQCAVHTEPLQATGISTAPPPVRVPL